MVKKTFFFLILSLSVLFFFVAKKTLAVPQEPVHYHANFAVFVEGKQVDFTKPSLMHIAPCTDDVHVSTDPKENVHLHDQIGNVVHLHMDGISWNTFFSTVGFDLLPATNEKSLSVYSKGKKVSEGVLHDTIQKQDEILVHIASQSGKEHISQDPQLQQEFEKVGTNASEYDAGNIGIEKCGAQGKRTLWQRMKIAFGL